jgi:hypothetical protein
MTHTSTLYEACQSLFDNYPLAVMPSDCGQTIRSMVLLLQDGDDAKFFVLSHDQSGGRAVYSLRSWPAGSIGEIGADGKTAPVEVVRAVTLGVPIPRDGSLFGWACAGTITALVTVYAEYAPECPEPSWAVMPLADCPEGQWPPFTGERLLGHWFWEYFQAGSVVTLSSLIAGRAKTVFWVDTKATLGSDCCAVAHDIRSPYGFTLPSGRYVYFESLRAGKPVPSLSELLTDTSRTDLAPLLE